ncbi:MAG: ricin-type beta-trefoil lectin domain protein [Patescibacteria group bacterium]
MKISKLFLFMTITTSLTFIAIFGYFGVKAYDVDNMMIRKIGSNLCLSNTEFNARFLNCNAEDTRQLFTLKDPESGVFLILNRGNNCLVENVFRPCFKTSNNNATKFKKTGWKGTSLLNLFNQKCMATAPADEMKNLIFSVCNGTDIFSQLEYIPKEKLSNSFKPTYLKGFFREDLDYLKIKHTPSDKCLDFDGVEYDQLFLVKMQKCEVDKDSQILSIENYNNDTYQLRYNDYCLILNPNFDLSSIKAWYCDNNNSSQMLSTPKLKQRKLSFKNFRTCLKDVVADRLNIEFNCNDTNTDAEFAITYLSEVESKKNINFTYFRRSGSNYCILNDSFDGPQMLECQKYSDNNLKAIVIQNDIVTITDTSNNTCLTSTDPVSMVSCNKESLSQQWTTKDNKLKSTQKNLCLGTFNDLPEQKEKIHLIDCQKDQKTLFDTLEYKSGKLLLKNKKIDITPFKTEKISLLKKKGTDKCITTNSSFYASSFVTFTDCNRFDPRQRISQDRLANGTLRLRNNEVCLNRTGPIDTRVCNSSNDSQSFEFKNSQLTLSRIKKCLASNTTIPITDSQVQYKDCKELDFTQFESVNI